MANKSNLKSIRLSDDLIELIEQQAGVTFTAKLENLVTRCVWELPEKERQLESIKEQIKKKQQMMAEASSRYARMINQLGKLEQQMYQLDYAIGRALDEWPDT